MSESKPNRPLPDPDENPGAVVVVWDGKCNFCRSQVERLRAFDNRSRLTYLSLHDPRVAERYPELSYDQLMSQMWVITPDHRRFGGADAVRFLSRHLPRLWWIAPVMHLPFTMPLWRYLYKVLANRRYRLAGKSCDGGTCDLHSNASAAKYHAK
jgi:predicted DCC family thiol-disulfide oxidoreductase YuxK